jgi:hypothetical protein
MSQKRDEMEGVAYLNGLLPAPLPSGALPVPSDHIRCSVCDRPLVRAPRDGRTRAIMVKCRGCGALQHRRL